MVSMREILGNYTALPYLVTTVSRHFQLTIDSAL
jgi:hypothetical protein